MVVVKNESRHPNDNLLEKLSALQLWQSMSTLLQFPGENDKIEINEVIYPLSSQTVETQCWQKWCLPLCCGGFPSRDVLRKP